MVLDHLVIQRMDTTGKQLFKKGQAEKSGQPFSKDELNAILKFGAAELFKEEDENNVASDEPVCDIDDILRRAETRTEEVEEDDDGLLSSFKVASLAMDEDEAVSSASKIGVSDGGGGGGAIQKLWDQIIPESYRAELEEEEREKELSELYLGPRQRKTVLQNGENKENQGKRKHESDDESNTDENEDDSPPKKKKKGKVNGFTDNEIRRFVKSYKKFAQPLTRMQDIATDADLGDKEMHELVDLGRQVRETCESAVENETEDKKAGNVKIGGVAVHAKKLIDTETLLRPLGKAIPSEKNDRLEWRLEQGTKDANFDVDWGAEEDSRLLIGIYEHGLGNWEEIKVPIYSFDLFCIPESFNSDISHQLFDYIITFVNSQQ